VRGPLINWLGLALGAAAALAALSTWQLAGGSTPAPARLSLVADHSHTLDVRPAGIALTRSIVPSASGSGLMRPITVRNATADPLRVRVRASSPDPALGRLVAVSVTTAGQTLVSGSVAGLRRPTAALLTLASHETAQLDVHAWLPPTRDDEWHARVGTVTVSFVTEPVGGPS
jgi:hypothetical protein